jgi:hypothetical protein
MPGEKTTTVLQSLPDKLSPTDRKDQDAVVLEHLADEVDKALKPVSPRPAYRKALRHDLVLTAQQKVSPNFIIENPFGRQRLLMIGALLGSALSLMGGVIAAWIIRARMLHSKAEQR